MVEPVADSSRTTADEAERRRAGRGTADPRSVRAGPGRGRPARAGPHPDPERVRGALLRPVRPVGPGDEEPPSVRPQRVQADEDDDERGSADDGVDRHEAERRDDDGERGYPEEGVDADEESGVDHAPSVIQRGQNASVRPDATRPSNRPRPGDDRRAAGGVGEWGRASPDSNHDKSDAGRDGTLGAMTDREPEPDDPLAPQSPAHTPSLPNRGSRWMALALLAVVLFGVAVWVVGLVSTLGLP